MFKNMQGLMQQAQKMQKQMQEAQEKLADLEMTGQSGAGMVNVVMNGKYKVVKVTLDPKAVDSDDVEMLEDLIVAALNDAHQKIEAHTSEEMGKMTQGMPIPPGFKLPF